MRRAVFSAALTSINDVRPDLNYLSEHSAAALVKPFLEVLLPENVWGKRRLKCVKSRFQRGLSLFEENVSF